jgi:drug/metabolite transporter (DMT)-like permease
MSGSRDGSLPARSPSLAAGPFALAAVTAIWGYSFLLVKDAVSVYPVFLFLAVRFTLAALLVAPFLLRRVLRAGRETILGGMAMGVALFTGYAFQTLGLLWTTAAHSGFITGLFVVLTPLFSALLTRKFPRTDVVAAVSLATAGLAALSLQGTWSGTGLGDLLSFCCAAVYAVHLLVTSHMARRYDTGALVLTQIATVAGLAWLFSLPRLGRIWPVPKEAVVGIAVTAVFATALAYWVQTAFQARVSAVQTAIIFTMEPVFAGLFAVLLGGERLGARGLLGGGLIVAAMLLGQTAEARRPQSP